MLLFILCTNVIHLFEQEVTNKKPSRASFDTDISVLEKTVTEEEGQVAVMECTGKELISFLHADYYAPGNCTGKDVTLLLRDKLNKER